MPKVLLVMEQTKLGASRVRDFVAHHRDAGRERVTSAQRAGDEVDGLGKLILEQSRSSNGGVAHEQIRHRTSAECDDPRGPVQPGEQPHDEKR